MERKQAKYNTSTEDYLKKTTQTQTQAQTKTIPWFLGTGRIHRLLLAIIVGSWVPEKKRKSHSSVCKSCNVVVCCLLARCEVRGERREDGRWKMEDMYQNIRKIGYLLASQLFSGSIIEVVENQLENSNHSWLVHNLVAMPNKTT